jgi:uncharacterized membrane protein YkvA (DUF1232 family)
MGLRISFELDDDDLDHFRLIMLQARNAATRRSPEEIVATADQLMQELSTQRTSGFITERLQDLRLMRRMISDVDWRLPHAETNRVLNALAYFAEPDDLIPDDIPGLGFLDDAIMIELVVRELLHEIEAYREFCDYRTQQTPRIDTELEAVRLELQSRMRQRREDDLQRDPNHDRRLLE